MRGGSVGPRCSRRSKPVTPSHAGPATRLLKNAELFLGQSATAFTGDLGEDLIQPGVELLLGEYRDGCALRAAADA